MDAGPAEAVDWTEDQARTFLDVLRAVSTHRDRERLFGAITTALREVLSFNALSIILDGPGPDEMTPYFMVPRIGAIPVRCRSESALEDVFVSGLPTYVRSRAELESRPGSLQILERIGAHSYLALPLNAGGRTLAALVLHASQAQAFDDVDVRFAGEIATAIAIALDHCLGYEAIGRARDRLLADNKLLRAELETVHAVEGVILESPAMREVLRLVELVAPTDATVLIGGATGSGKERVARLIHARSARAEQPLVSINCAAIPSSLIESELFGHEVGAFTGAARRRRGRFELAHGGTLLLDEIGELSLDAQARLLRILQTQELERVGGSETIKVDVRVIAATNRDLTAMVSAGRFRGDLYYRLAVFPLELPALADRPEDIVPLARLFVERAARRLGRIPPHLDDVTLRALVDYPWPGNVRELENLIERAVILSRGGIIDVASLLEPGVAAPEPPPAAGPDDEAGALRAALHATGWVIEGETGAAARLGLSPSTLRSRMRRFGIERPR